MKTKLKIFTVLLFAFAACKKDNTEQLNPVQSPTTINLSLDDARSYVEQELNDNANNSSVLNKLRLDWQAAKSQATKDGNIWKLNLPGHPIYQGIEQGYRQLVIKRDPKTSEIDARIIEVIPDAVYLQKGSVRISNFTGRVFEYNLGYKLTGGQLYSDGKQIGEIGPKENFELQRKEALGDLNPLIGIQGKLMKMQVIESCTWYQSSYIDANGDLTIHSERICSYSFYDDGTTFFGGDSGGSYSGGGSAGGGGGGSSPTNPKPLIPAPSNLPGETNNIVDPKKMMECFSQITDPNAAFVVRVYVIEPQPGTSFNVGANSFGHVAISLSKTSGSTTITQTVGFYPTGSGLQKLDSKSQVLDNGDIKYNIGATYYVNSESFQKVINYISNPPLQYHFTDFNCSAFVYGAGQAGGIPIPDPITAIGIIGPGGAGYAKTPAGMAGALREQKANNPNSDINEGGGNIPASKGECN
ncbi:hypothetical protein EA772_01685 [Pedobacter sp. G11]|uniref:hypothetical protein n=1 Tax=Pedobacter sp. G11 TaxID=2482728 RepID=UPI000F603BF9|nr:hypothetical protein [Pedobacter sp. G11]AZI24116.1 hypothetical protein EA772_01685 [Pedobacter sp. G11]